MKDGLSNENNFVGIQDSEGFIWVGAQEELNVYDGKTFRIYKNDPADPDSLPRSTGITSLFKDSTGTLWIGLEYGELSKYDKF